MSNDKNHGGQVTSPANTAIGRQSSTGYGEKGNPYEAYDKVQRVKNKWKCTLKDGVLNANGKEWLFHKGNGEFEW